PHGVSVGSAQTDDLALLWRQATVHQIGDDPRCRIKAFVLHHFHQRAVAGFDAFVEGHHAFADVARDAARAPVDVAFAHLDRGADHFWLRAGAGGVFGFLDVLRRAGHAAVHRAVAGVRVHAVAQGQVAGEVDVQGRHAGI